MLMNIFISCSLVLTIALTGCTRKTSKNISTTEKPPFRVIISDVSTTLDWNQANLIDGVKELLTETILTYTVHPDGRSELAPALASAWAPKEKGRVWEFQIRQDILWSDGEPLKAEQIKDSVERFLKPETAAFLASGLYVVKGAQDFNAGKLKDFSKVAVTVVNGSTLRFELVRPIAYFPHLMTMVQMGPIRKDLIAKYPNGDWLKPENFVTVGPYVLVSYAQEQSLVLKANPRYYGGAREVESVIGLTVYEPTSGVNMFESGAVDLIFNLPAGDFARLQTLKEFHAARGSSPGFLAFSVTSPAAKNPNLRQALSLALDRREIAKVFPAVTPEKFIAAEAFHVMPPHELYNDKDLVRAKELLKKANLPADFKLVLTARTESNLIKVAENVQHQLKTKLGLNIEINTLERATLRGLMMAGQLPFFLYVMGADFLDPHSVMDFFTSNSTQNILNWRSPKYDRLIEAAGKEFDQSKRYKLYAEANHVLSDDAFYVPIFAYSYPYLLSEKFTGLNVPAMYRIDLRHIRYKK